MATTGSKLRDHAINTLIATIGSLLVLFGTGAWNRKENSADHTLDVQQVRAAERADMEAVKNDIERLLDILCEPKPNTPLPRRCTEPLTASSSGDVLRPQP